jgi:O-antigen/teichoic acid export membrane protein
VSTVSGLLTTLLTVRLLGVRSYGLLAVGLAGVALASVAARLGLGGAVVRSIAAMSAEGRRDAVASIVHGASGIVVVSGGAAALVVATVVAITTPDTAPFAGLTLGVGLALLLFGRVAAAAASFVARGLGRMAWIEVPGVVVTVLQLVAVVVLFGMGVDDVRVVAAAYGVVGVAAFATSAAAVRTTVAAGWEALRPRRGDALALLRTAAPYAVSGIAVQVISQLDVVVLGIARGSVEVGKYEPALRLTDRVLLLVPALFLAGFLPAATSLVARGERRAFHELYVDVSKLVFVFAMPLVCALIAFPSVWLRMLFGAGFPASPAVVRVLLIGYVANLAFGLNSSALVASGSRRPLALAHAVAFAMMVVLALALIPPFGAIGAASATSASYVVLNVVVGVALLRVSGVHPFSHAYLATLLSGGMLLAVSAWLGDTIDVGSALEAGTWTAALWLSWVTVLLTIRVIRIGELAALIPSRRKSLR